MVAGVLDTAGAREGAMGRPDVDDPQGASTTSMRLQAAANHYTALAGTVLLGATLLAAIWLTATEHQWVVFLAGVLAAAVLAYLSRTVNTRWIITRRTAQLHATRSNLAGEIQRRTVAEESLACARGSAELIDETLPAMLAYLDTGRRVRYHNRAYTRWLGQEGTSIDGRLLEDIVGSVLYREIEAHLRSAFEGHDVRYERLQTMPNGETCRLHVQYLPSFAEDGKVAGIFAILTDVTRPEMRGVVRPEDGGRADANVGERLLSALKHDAFTLYWQAIVPVGRDAPAAPFHEVLLRMKDEEESHLPPGTFLPWAEEFGLLHEIDRWVVRHVVDFAADGDQPRDAVYMVNLSDPTLLDPGFAKTVRERLEARGVSGRALCLEFTESQVLSNPAAYREFVAALKGLGCRFAVSGFGRNPLSLRLLKQLGANILKLDGGIVLAVACDPVELARVRAMSNAAHAADMRIVAECVEHESTRAALEDAGVDFVQGFGVAMPVPMGTPCVADGRSEAPPGSREAIA